MTSLELFPHVETSIKPPEPPEWGTGKFLEKPKVNLWAPKAPTWHYTGDPTKQHYTLTKLKLSNVRLNDQLLPRPQDCDMGKLMIKNPWPTEHPYASHISRFSVIPKFDTPEDAKRGFQARKEMPKNAEMPSQAYDVTIVRKVKGNAFRHEIQSLPPESEKKPLYWHDGGKFDQLVKSPWGGQQPYYPTPPKIFNPNLDQRDDSKVLKGNMEISAKTANATRNVEREHWQTTYDLNHTGLGPANPKALDNFDDKRRRKNIEGTGKDEDDLHPRSIRTFDPARPMEGRIARALVPPPSPQTDQWPDGQRDPNYQRKMTLTEKEEDRLWNGKEYENHPQKLDEEYQWKRTDNQNHPESGLKTLGQALANAGPKDSVPYEPAPPPPKALESGIYLDDLLKDQNERIQQMEATNRWKVLESQTPAHNLTSRQHKMNVTVDKTQPEVFYKHEGKYQRERAGLYKTSYDPYELQYSMNKDKLAGSEIFYTMDSHKDAFNLPYEINNEMAELMREGRTLGGPPGSVPQLHDQSAPHEVFDSYDRLRALQKARLQPTVDSADVKTQESGTVLKESTYGDGYNTQKFLQENKMPFHTRKEPTVLVSQDNQDLKRCKMVATSGTGRSVQFANDVTVAEGANGQPIRMTSAPLNAPMDGQFSKSFHPETATGIPMISRSANGRVPITTSSMGGGISDMHRSLPVALEKSRRAGASERLAGRNFFEGNSCSMGPPLRKSWNASSAYTELYPGNNHVDMTFKTDKRFDWSAGSGMPRPQSHLLQIQDSFTKTEARRRFHEQFPEQNPDLRENITAGKKHDFIGGLNAQVLRGTPLVA